MALTNVYVVDDDAMVRRSTVLMLGAAGYAVRPFGGGRDFLDEREWLAPGCVLLDVRMPDVDGFGVLSTLKEEDAKFLSIVMTGHGDIATAVQVMKMGATDFLEKPFEENVLIEMLERLAPRLESAQQQVSERDDARRRVATLSPREVEVLSGLAGGLPNKVVAGRLSLSVRTVEMHRANLMEKLQVRALADALRIAFQADLCPPPDPSPPPSRGG